MSHRQGFIITSVYEFGTDHRLPITLLHEYVGSLVEYFPKQPGKVIIDL
jgi:hypothetical protein